MKLDTNSFWKNECEAIYPLRLPATLPLFDMPDSMVGIFNRDLAAAGIDKEDERGRTLDVHALRHNAVYVVHTISGIHSEPI